MELATFYLSPGFCDERLTVFLARDLHEVPPSAQGVEEEHLEIARVALTRVNDLVASGELRDVKSIAGLLLARDHLARPLPDAR